MFKVYWSSIDPSYVIPSSDDMRNKIVKTAAEQMVIDFLPNDVPSTMGDITQEDSDREQVRAMSFVINSKNEC